MAATAATSSATSTAATAAAGFGGGIIDTCRVGVNGACIVELELFEVDFGQSAAGGGVSSGQEEHVVKINQEGHCEGQEGVAGVFHRHRDASALQQGADLGKGVGGASVIVAPGGIFIDVVRDRIGIGFGDGAVDGTVALDPDIAVFHIDHEHSTAVRAE